MPAPINPFPLNITTKQDSWDKLQLLLHLDPSLKLTAAEINKIVQALEYINNNLVTGGYTGNVPLSIVAVAIDHSASGAPAEKIKTVLNSGPNIPLQDGATQWFSTKRMVLTNGAGINNGEPGGANYAVITEYFWLRKKIPLIGGIASLGTGGTALETADIVPLFTIDTRNLAPQEFDLGNIGSTAVWTAANTSGPRSTPNTATIIFKAVQNGAPKVWLYIGQQENVGIGYPAVGTADFRIFPADGVGTDPAPAPAQRIYKFYDDVAELLIRQREQTGNELIRLTNATADPALTFPAGETRLQAYYRYKGTTAGTMADYELISAPWAIRPPQQKIKTGNFTLAPEDNDNTISMDGGICTINPNTQTYQDAYIVAMKNITDSTDGSIVCTTATGWTYKVNDAATVTDGTFTFPAGATCTIIKFEGTNKIYIDGGVE